jgi:hypothetical protein
MLKATRHWTPNWETYGILMTETDLPQAFGPRSDRHGIYYIFGCQFAI